MMLRDTIRTALLAGLLTAPLWVASSAFAHSGEKHEEPEKAIDYTMVEEHEFGKAADPAQAARTIRVEMSDQMRFTPDVIEVRTGEIVHLEIHNKGQLLHELVLGTTEDLQTHAALMKKFPGMEHEEPHMAHVPSGKMGKMGWQFTKPGEFYYGCLIPGHFDAGMIGKIIVR